MIIVEKNIKFLMTSFMDEPEVPDILVNIFLNLQNLGVTNEIGGNCPCKIENAVCNVNNDACECKEDFITSHDKIRCIPKRVELGKACENQDQCTRYDSFSSCVNHTCKCLKNFTEDENSCKGLLGFQNTNCSLREDCTGKLKIANSICINSTCACKSHYVASQKGDVCLKSVSYGENCEENEDSQCHENLGPNSICLNKICICKEGFMNKTEDDNSTICIRATSKLKISIMVGKIDIIFKFSRCRGFL